MRDSLWAALPPHCRRGVEECLPRLLSELPRERVADNTVMVAFGGGKDSAYTISFVRAMQLELHRERGVTFRMRVVTNRHAGMPLAVMENIERVYDALAVEEDPACEQLLVDGDVVRHFRVEEPRPAELVERNRVDILMAGHLTQADGRPTFCNACNLSVANSFGVGASYGEGADVIVTGDSLEEQRAYLAWIRSLAAQLGVESARRLDFKTLLSTLDGIAAAYFQEVHGSSVDPSGRRVASDVPANLRFFTIYEDTDYASGDHWDLLTDFLGFSFDRLAFSFTESDCANPALMAHLRGLKAERLFGRGYEEGLGEYVEFALGLMRAKSFPEELVEVVARRYRGHGAAARMRGAMDAYALETFGLDEEQLVCMVYSPFVGEGERMSRFLSEEYPSLASRLPEIEERLAGGEEGGGGLGAALERLSALRMEQLRTLYRKPSPPAAGMTGEGGMLGTILARDPHKALISTRHSPTGPVVKELISGR
ncbi:MAG TPA: hypothetical protein VFS48_04710 [Solirubrobacterales bacterium]|nr:hypothetical protein [Solirubrobacterales bacterium]